MKTVQYPRVVGLGVCLSLLLAGCGNDLKDNTPPPPPSAPDAVEVNPLPEQVKKLSLVWTDVEGATRYRVMGNPDGVSGFTQIGADIDPGVEFVTLSEVPLTERLNAEYLVESCNDIGCTASDTVFTDATLDDAIGYVKPPSADTNLEFGTVFKVSADGQTLVAGHPEDDSAATGINGDSADRSATETGAVVVYKRLNDQWQFDAYLKNAVPAANFEKFGQAVDVSADGNTIAVGVPSEESLSTDPTDNSGSNVGAVHIFERVDGTWSQTDYIKAEVIKAGGLFGTDVVLSGDGNYLAISSPGDGSNSAIIDSGEADNSLTDAGSVHVYRKVLFGDFEREAYLKPSDAGASHLFGSQIDLSFDGSVLVANSPGSDSGDGSVVDVGAVVVFKRSDTTWTEYDFLRDPTAVTTDRFGYKVSLSGEGVHLAISNPNDSSSAAGIGGDETDTSMPNAGSVAVYEDDGISMNKVAFIKSEAPKAEYRFGEAIALSDDGDRLIATELLNDGSGVGLRVSPFDADGKSGSGAAYDYSSIGGVWSYNRFFKAPNAETGDGFGRQVSMSSDESLIAVGAYFENGNGTLLGGDPSNNDQPLSGAIYLY